MLELGFGSLTEPTRLKVNKRSLSIRRQLVPATPTAPRVKGLPGGY